MKSWLEESLVRRGEDVSIIVPNSLVGEWKEKELTDNLWGVSHWSDYQALADLAGRLDQAQVTNVVTVDEPAVRAAAFVRSLLGVQGQTLHDAVAFTDKAVMKARLASAGLPVVPHRVVRALEEVPRAAAELGWPVVVKPRDGFGTVNTHMLTDEAEFEKLVESGAFSREQSLPPSMTASTAVRTLEGSSEGFLVEAAVREVVAEYHCELLVDGGRERYCVPARYETPCIESVDGSTGSVMLVDGDQRATVAELTRAAAVALNLTSGFAHCEVLENSQGRFFIGEIGSRPGGAQVPHLLRLQYGIDVAEVAADLAQSRTVDLSPIDRERPVAWCSVPMPSGTITAMSSPADIVALPGVVDVKCFVSPGDRTRAFRSSVSSAAHVFCEGDTDQAAQRRAAEVARAWRFTCA
ncbi:hypothetical protein AB0F42_26555 [Streptomyces buecherae]|uniref:ATP-grasp domain-containing protein n=1 Tax=Streptomyces buecherae TaxID=2763006 RepID=UPI0033DD37BF